MTMLGRESIQDFQKCRHVCQNWKVMMSQMTKCDKATIIRQAESLAAKTRKKLEVLPHLPEITTAASLAHHGLLGSLKDIWLEHVDLSSVPAEHLASLASCVTGGVFILNLDNCDMISFLDSVKCIWLSISSQTLSSEETRALVRVMESRVERVGLGSYGEVSLDITALTQYSGQGKCGEVRCYNDTADRYREEVRSWAQRIELQDFQDTFIRNFWRYRAIVLVFHFV